MYKINHWDNKEGRALGFQRVISCIYNPTEASKTTYETGGLAWLQHPESQQAQCSNPNTSPLGNVGQGYSI